MKWFIRLLRIHKLTVTIGFLLLILLIWFFGGKALNLSVETRLIAIVIVMVLWVIVLLVEQARAKKGAEALEQSIKAQAEDQVFGVRPDKREQVEKLKQNLTDAIRSLKGSKLAKGRTGSAALYALPWYIMIGPPAAGKTTAIRNSGLDFPVGDYEIQGIGGTRNCDWFFSNSAILLDTAGRWSTEEDDKEEWLAFLDILKKHRRRQPINGVLIGVSIRELAEADVHGLEDLAKKMRARIDELMQRLGVRFPVYLVFTKCDLLKGFTAFFEDLSRRQREQVWGATFVREQQEDMNPKGLFEREFRGILQRLFAMRLARLSTQMRSEKRRNVYVFPLELAAAQENLALFVGKLFRPNAYQESPLFRGFYFTSGTQEGAPLDRVLLKMAETFDLPGEEAYEPERETKTFFVTDLLQDVVIPDHSLVRLTSRTEHQRRLLQRGTMALAALLLALFVIGVVNAYFTSKSSLTGLEDAARELRNTRPDAWTAFPETMRGMERIRKEIIDLQECADRIPVMSLGMSRCADGLVAGRALYFSRMRTYMASFVVNDLEAALRNPSATPREEKYRLLKTYLLLGNYQRKLYDLEEERTDTANRTFLSGQIFRLLDRKLTAMNVSGETRTLAGQQAAFYLENLSIGRDSLLTPDQVLVRAVRTSIYEPPSVETAYARLKQEIGAGNQILQLPDIIPSGYNDLLRSDVGVDAVFTRRGWETVVQEAIGRESANPGKEDWVMGVKNVQLPRELQHPAALEQSLRARYFREYGDAWWQLLRSVRYDPFANINDASRKLMTLGDPGTSPLARLLREVSVQTNIVADQQEAAQGGIGGTLNQLAQRIGVGQGQNHGQQGAPQDFSQLSGRFAGIRALTEGDNGPLLRLLAQLNMVGDRLDRLGGDDSKTIQLASEVMQESGEIPKAVRDINATTGTLSLENSAAIKELFVQPVMQAWDVVLARTQGYLNDQWRASVVEPYEKSYANRYPLKRNATEEIPPEDLGSFFSLDQESSIGNFLEKQLKPFVDLSTLQPKTWDGRGIRIQSSVLSFLGKLRKMSGFTGATDNLRFSVKPHPPVTISKGATPSDPIEQIVLLLDGKELKYQMGNPYFVDMTWPGSGSPGATLRVSVATGDIKKWDGPGQWGFFRLLDQAQVTQASGREYDCKWTITDRYYDVVIRFTIKASGNTVPFSPGFFNLQCPSTLN